MTVTKRRAADPPEIEDAEKTETAKTTTKTIAFFHPDLGIGGAERLVVDAAVGLQQRGHRVVIFTSHCDPAHCFDEVRPARDGGVLDVRVRGGSVVPAAVLGRFAILCAIARQLHLLWEVWTTGELAALAPTAVFVDQLSAGLPVLEWMGRGGTEDKKDKKDKKGRQVGMPLLFYCHFPDLLLAQGRQRWWKRLYRVPFDALEQWTMGFADAVSVNSRFTRGVVAETWPRLAAQTDLRVVYPCIDVSHSGPDDDDDNNNNAPWDGMPYLLSINRFERKKDVGLAIRAFAQLPSARRAGARLVLAGGYDPRVAENVAHHRELDDLASSLGLSTATAKTLPTALAVPAHVDVLFLLSVPSALKSLLLAHARLLLYTPAREHFGIVPLEAMLAGLPVLACDTGGPTETVVEGETGWLRSPDNVAAWTEVIDRVLPAPAGVTSPSSSSGSGSISAAERQAMAAAGRARVRSQFAVAQMAARLEAIYDELEDEDAGHKRKPGQRRSPVFMLAVLLSLALGSVLILVGFVMLAMDCLRAGW